MDRSDLTLVVARGIVEEVEPAVHADDCESATWITEAAAARTDGDHAPPSGGAVCHECGATTRVLRREDAQGFTIDKRGEAELREYLQDRQPSEFLSPEMDADPRNDTVTTMKLSFA